MVPRVVTFKGKPEPTRLPSEASKADLGPC